MIKWGQMMLSNATVHKLFWVVLRRLWAGWKGASHRGYTQNGCWLASGRLSALLEMALQSSTDGWPKEREQRDPGSDLSHGGRKSNLGSPTHPRGAIKAGLQSIGEHGFPMGSASSETSRFGQALADVLAEPSRGHCSNGLLHGTKAHLWCTVLLLCSLFTASEPLQIGPSAMCLPER